MKKTLLSLLMLVFGFQTIQAQTTLDTAVNIIGTDIDGNSFNLFNTLNSGKYVVIDFLFTTCGPCQLAAPKYYGAFVNYGSNDPAAQIVFISINRDDNNSVMHSWEQTYSNPTGPYPIGFSGTEGSDVAGPQAFYTLYGIGAFPTFILIEPNRHIAEKDMWPITDPSTFTTYFQAHGLNPVAAGIIEVNPSSEVSIYPIPAQDEITLSSESKAISGLEIIDQLGNIVFKQDRILTGNTCKYDVSAYKAGIYYIRVSLDNDTQSTLKFVKL
ncbi:MAG: T9SS type A sorting domain-containing protein [Bacteroidota bacterium]